MKSEIDQIVHEALDNAFLNDDAFGTYLSYTGDVEVAEDILDKTDI